MSDSQNDPAPDERQDSDYDGAWKEAIRLHLREFIETCFADIAALIDWTSEPEWLEKEISQIFGKTGHRNREVDLLFKVRLKDGRDQWIFCHLEIQASYEADFPFRIDLYNAGLKWTFQKQVITLVILADLRPEWRPSEHHFSLGGFGTDIRFPVCKLLDRLNSDWVDNRSLVSQVARAQIAALRTSSDPEARYSEKTQLVRNLYKMGYTSDRIREAFRLIDWMMHLRSDLDRRFKTELVAFEQELQMPYVTSIERIAKEEGLEEGLEQGREEGGVLVVLKQLPHFCGPLPADIEKQLRQLSFEQVQNLGETLFNFKSLEDLKNWLKGEAS